MQKTLDSKSRMARHLDGFELCLEDSLVVSGQGVVAGQVFTGCKVAQVFTLFNETLHVVPSFVQNERRLLSLDEIVSAQNKPAFVIGYKLLLGT